LWWWWDGREVVVIVAAWSCQAMHRPSSSPTRTRRRHCKVVSQPAAENKIMQETRPDAALANSCSAFGGCCPTSTRVLLVAVFEGRVGAATQEQQRRLGDSASRTKMSDAEEHSDRSRVAPIGDCELGAVSPQRLTTSRRRPFSPQNQPTKRLSHVSSANVFFSMARCLYTYFFGMPWPSLASLKQNGCRAVAWDMSHAARDGGCGATSTPPGAGMLIPRRRSWRAL
jgi:hypothetical protein